MVGVSRMLTKGLLKEGDKGWNEWSSKAHHHILSTFTHFSRMSNLNLYLVCLPGRQLSVTHGQ